MPAERINPAALYNSQDYAFSHACRSDGTRMLHLAGQVAWDSNCNLVGGDDLAAQTRQCLSNLRAVLASEGATPADLLRIRTYVVNHTPDKLGPIAEELMAFYGDVLPAPNTLIGVQTLALPEFLIEIEGTASLT